MNTYVLTVLVLFTTSVKCLQNKYCQLSCDFGIKTVSHTVCDRQYQKCGPHPRCGPDFRVVPLTNQVRQFILDLHNNLRNKVAMGNERRGGQPPAANMHVLTYNKELEYIAQCWANTCNGNPLVHDTCRRTAEYSHVGQNLGFVNSSEPFKDFKKTIKELVMLWYDEVSIFSRNWVPDTRDRGPKTKVGHYTQMMWADTSEVGCALTYYTTQTTRKWNHIVLVCNYGPGGNYLGLPVYQIGEPTSKCPKDMKPNSRYRGLCGETKKVNEVKKIHNIFDF